MQSEQSKKNEQEANNEDSVVKPDSETLHTTDPQEHMKGFFSSLVHKVEKDIESKGSEKGDNNDTDT